MFRISCLYVLQFSSYVVLKMKNLEKWHFHNDDVIALICINFYNFFQRICIKHPMFNNCSKFHYCSSFRFQDIMGGTKSPPPALWSLKKLSLNRVKGVTELRCDKLIKGTEIKDIILKNAFSSTLIKEISWISWHPSTKEQIFRTKCINIAH